MERDDCKEANSLWAGKPHVNKAKARDSLVGLAPTYLVCDRDALPGMVGCAA